MDTYLQQECRRFTQIPLASKIDELQQQNQHHKQRIQELAAEVECTRQAERDLEQARGEAERTLEARNREITEIAEENQNLLITLATERSMLDEAKLEEQRMRENALEQERLRLESQRQQRSLEQDLQSLQLDNQSLQEQLSAALADQPGQPPRPVDIAPWNVPRNEIHTSHELGRGGWGVVMQGTFRENTVAVKFPHKDILNQRLLDRLRRETRMMLQVQHPNLIGIIAAVFDEAANRLRSPPIIITELLDINLRQCYQRGRLQAANRMPVFLDVAYGLHYLHDRQEPIIHRDVSAPNVLLKALPNGMWRAKVSDFGSANLARLSMTAGEGAIIYTPPEAFPQMDPKSPRIPQTTKIDVYSFGVLMCEVITAEQPDPDIYHERLEQVRRSSIPMHGLIVRCTDRSPDKRPTMAAVIDDLNRIPL